MDFPSNPNVNQFYNGWRYDGHNWQPPPGGGSGGGNGPNIPGFDFNWNQAEKDAMAELEPYYRKKLEEAGGDVNLAKQRIEEDYQQGLRYNREDREVQMAADTRSAQEETMATKDNLNQRGILFSESGDEGQKGSGGLEFSGVAKALSLNPLATKQEARRAAIQRAIERSDQSLATTKSRGVEDADIALKKTTNELNQEKQEKAVLQMAPLKYQQAYNKYQATVGRSLNPYLQS